MANITVIGGAGFISSHLIDAFVSLERSAGSPASVNNTHHYLRTLERNS